MEKIQQQSNQRLFPKFDGGDQLIRSLCNEAAKSQYGDPIPEIVKNRLEKELDSIIKHGFIAPYLIAREVVNQSVADGYMVGTRGSVGSCIAAYLLGISEVNPLPPHYLCKQCKHIEWITTNESPLDGFDLQDKECPSCGGTLKGDGHNIPCEMFLGIKHDKAPDIDLNVAAEYQERAHNSIKEIYGHNNVFHAGRANNGVHPGGIFIVPNGIKIEDITPIRESKLKMKTKWKQTQLDYHELDHILLKLDILKHKDPSIMRLLHDLTGVDPKTVPLNDRKVMSLFRSTEALGVTSKQIRSAVATYGIPEMGTSFVRRMLEEMQPSSFNDLLQISGLSHGSGTWEGNTRELIQDGSCTLQAAIALRDNVVLELINHGIEADLAFQITENIRNGKGLEEHWIEEMKKCNVPDWYIDSCKKIKYLFPKAHSVTYVISALRNAFYKLYYPLEFYAAKLTVLEKPLDIDLCSKGYEAILNKIEQMEEQTDQKPDAILDLINLELALEITARGLHFDKGNPLRDEYYITDMNRSLTVRLTQ